MTDRLLQAVPRPVSLELATDVRVPMSTLEALRKPAVGIPVKPLVEPREAFLARTAILRPLPGPRIGLGDLIDAVSGRRVSHRRWQSTIAVGQGGRGSCWAFAGIAALEAAYARTGVRELLSPHYLFHLSKAWSNHASGGGIHSLVGFQGSSDIVHHLTHFKVPLARHVPYIDQGPLQALANAIPGTGGALNGMSGSGTREQADWLEYDLRHIPLMGRWFAQFGVRTYGHKANFSVADIKAVLRAGHDVVVDVWDKINSGGHVILIFGYDDNTSTFEIKNSQTAPGFATMRYTGDAQFDIDFRNMYWITGVTPVESQWAAMWTGRWETDHDGWRGRLIIRRFTDLLGAVELPGPSSRIGLGTWYAEDGRQLDVVGHFVDGGRGLHCAIGGQPFELYLHGSDPYRAGGRCWWNGIPFGVVLSRGTAVGAGVGFHRTETIGLWDTVHDGWRGTMRIGVDPAYVQAADAVARGARIDPGATAHKVDMRVNFGATNSAQHFELLHHTREDGLMGGVTHWGGRSWPVEARMSRNLYAITATGALRWYRHTGRPWLNAAWDEPRTVGSGWSGFRAVFGGGDGVIYAIRPNGELLWYHHDGRNQGQVDWQGGRVVGWGWQTFSRVFAGDGGVIYAVRPDGVLLWYRHQGRRDGSVRWEGPREVGVGWNGFSAISAAPDGGIYGTLPDGRLLWYRHYGHDQGDPIWHGPLQVGHGWQPYDRIWAVGNGYFYGRKGANGELWLWRHHGFLVGDTRWTAGVHVGTGWSAGMTDVIAT